jgi:hypothetical protein
MCESQYASFLIRCWSHTGAEGKNASWQGEIEHIQTGRITSIHSLEELVAILNEWPAGPDGSGSEGVAA